MGVGRNWLSDLSDSCKNVSCNSRESSRTVSSVIFRGLRKSSKDCWCGSCPDAMLGVSAVEE